MTNLKDINFGINQYCGPAVLSALTGESTDHCAAVISIVSGRKEIKAVNKEHLREALKKLNFNVSQTSFDSSTLYGSLVRMYMYDGLYIVFVSGHVVAIEIRDNKIYICDNHTKTPIDINQSARLTQKVVEVWKVTRKVAPKFIRAEVRIIRNINNTLDIISYSHHENREDDFTFKLGSIKFTDKLELRQIVEALKNEL